MGENPLKSTYVRGNVLAHVTEKSRKTASGMAGSRCSNVLSSCSTAGVLWTDLPTELQECRQQLQAHPVLLAPVEREFFFPSSKKPRADY